VSRESRDEAPGRLLETTQAPADISPREKPPASAEEREADWTADHDVRGRDIRPALGTRGGPARWRRAKERASVALARGRWGDAAWSFLYRRDTDYSPPVERTEVNRVRAAARKARTGELTWPVQGPVIKAPVWTWEIPLYFWFGGIAAGSSFVALSCDLAGDHRSARTARAVALGALVPCPVLLVADLGRPARFLNMLRIVKLRSPMSLGAWCLTVFGALISAAVGADLLGRRDAARGLGAGTAVAGGYLGSYTGVLLAATAVPVWARSRLFLGPIFVATATATGAAASRLVLVATGLPERHATRTALGRVETGAISIELLLARANKRRLGRLKGALDQGRPGRLFKVAEGAVMTGLVLRLARRYGSWTHHVASALYLLGGLAFRFAWVGAGQTSARDDEGVALAARAQATFEDKALDGLAFDRRVAGGADERSPMGGPQTRYAEAVRRLTLLVERIVGRLRPGSSKRERRNTRRGE
jgi:hypothetical protein